MNVFSIQSFSANSTILSISGLLSNGTLEGTVTIHTRSLERRLLQVSNLSFLGLFSGLQICLIDGLMHISMALLKNNRNLWKSRKVHTDRLWETVYVSKITWCGIRPIRSVAGLGLGSSWHGLGLSKNFALYKIAIFQSLSHIHHSVFLFYFESVESLNTGLNSNVRLVYCFFFLLAIVLVGSQVRCCFSCFTTPFSLSLP
jgi:hypothetical protein